MTSTGAVIGITCCVTAMICCIVFTVLLCSWNRCLKWKILYCCKTKLACFRRRKIPTPNGEGGPTNFEYDVYIGYCFHDRTFVYEQLHKRLELDGLGGNKMKLYLYHRDNIPGGFLGDELSQKMDESKCLLIVLSDKYLAMPWHDFELKIAAFNVSTYKQKLVIVELQPCGKQTGCTVTKGSLDLNGTAVPVSIQKLLKMCKDKVEHVIVKYAENAPAVFDDTTIENIRKFVKGHVSPTQARRVTVRESVLMCMMSSDQYSMVTNIQCNRCHHDLYLTQITPACCEGCKALDSKSVSQSGDVNQKVSRTKISSAMVRRSTLLSNFLHNHLAPIMDTSMSDESPSMSRGTVTDVPLEGVLIKPGNGSDPRVIRQSMSQYMSEQFITSVCDDIIYE